MRKILVIPLVAAAAAVAPVARSATITQQFNVQMTIQAECTALTAGALNFGTTGVITSEIDQTASISVTCTNTHPYEVRLDKGVAGTAVADRKMARSGGGTINYQLYKDSGRSQVWGDTGGDVLSSTGTGVAQSHTVYGRVPAPQSPVPGTYSDTITVTISF